METTADTNLTSGDSHVTDTPVVDGETTPESSFDDAPNDVGDEEYYVSYRESTDSSAEPLNLSATPSMCDYQLEEATQGRPMAMDAQMQRSIDVRTLRELGTMSPYLLHIPTSRHLHGFENINMNQQNGAPQNSEEGENCNTNCNESSEPSLVEGVEGVEGHYNGLDLSAMSNETEVMRAARALFSKRTRTLYHWIYPDTPKIQLKAVVSKAWDSMLNTEKQFYVSQVLGKFGCLQSQLMINPQLGSFTTPPTPQDHRTHVQQVEQAHRLYMEEASRASAAMTSRPSYVDMHTQFYNNSIGPGPIRRRRGRPRSATTPAALHQRYGDLRSIYVQRLQAVKRLADGDIPLPMMHLCEMDERECSSVPVSEDIPNHTHNTCTTSAPMAENEFTDDPELRQEFEKFEWTLHMVD